MLKLILRIINISGKYKKRINIAFVFSFLKSMFMNSAIFISFFVVTGFLQNSITESSCLYLAFATVGCLILQIIFQYIADRLQSTAGFLIFSDMRLKLGTHLRRMPMGYFTEGNIGKISSVLSTDMVFIEENSMTSISDMMNYLFSQLIMAVFMYFIDVRLGLCCTAVILVILLIGRLMRSDTMKHSSIRQEQNESLTEAVIDFTEGIGIIKTYNLLGDKSRELTNTFEDSCNKNIAFEKNHAPWARAINLAYGIGTVAVIAAAVLLYASELLSAEMCLGTLLFAVNLFIPIKSFYANCTRLTVMDSCLDRIEAVFNEKELADNGTEILPTNGNDPEISFENVTFGYGNKDILHNISFKAEKNTMIALVGPSGGGKSTIANLIARFWDIKSGCIKIRGKEIRNIPLSELTNQISMVFQRVYLFQDTIYNNICIGRPDADEEEVIDAAKKARCYDFIMALPDGFQTVIGEGGASLSGGEQQRISIARCILKDAPIVILDEATASVDSDNERYIQEAISELCLGKTLIVIAHKLNTIKNADKILVISDGRIAECGRHDKLIKEGGIYCNFVNARNNSKGWNART